MIVGGQPVPLPNPYPATASLQFHNIARDDPNWHTCGAYVVNIGPRRDVVATAAHCVTERNTKTIKDPNLFHLRIGSADQSTGGVVAYVEAIATPKFWDWGMTPGVGMDGDIALLRLDRNVPVNGFPILPRANRHDPVKLVGWGLTEVDGTATPKHLQELNVELRTSSECAAGAITVGELCLDSPAGTGAWFGDSGGPALQRIGGRWFVVGIASRQASTGPGRAIYTDVGTYLYWILRTVATDWADGRHAEPEHTLTRVS
ncbi:trypsin-like serine protease [Micromonospora sp. WMMD1102]|uniref:S1 family peptidase n=1 Tax=Micromonospora sp. WMMD1102 TaxID=3016105 RepID=UPI0024152948|nr:trypsin-like serine protease [Micromonospora sp. WMMD1102]MDG4790155.1 trypsin-like serine protease [Micromonospora sp. WMMD1102]